MITVTALAKEVYVTVRSRTVTVPYTVHYGAGAEPYSDVAVGMVEKSLCMAFHPGQKLMSPSYSKSVTSTITAKGSVIITSKTPSTRSLRNPLRSIDALLARAPFRSLLCLKYVNINLAEGSQKRLARVLFILTGI